MTATSSSEPSSKKKALAQALEKMEQPTIRWKLIAQIVAGFAIVWVTSFMVVPYVGYWGVGVSGVLTLVALGFVGYVWRLTRRSRAIFDIVKGATTEEGRLEALEQLSARSDSNEAMNALARAQLLAQHEPSEAIAILEAVDIAKAPAVVQDDVRANLAVLYLLSNRVREARELVDDLRLDRQPQPRARAMYAAVSAEAFARTGKASEARKLLETYGADDPEYGDARPMLLRAQVYTYFATKNRGLGRRAMEQLVAIDPNALAPFVQRGTAAEITKLARELLARAGAIPKPKMRVRMH